MEHATVIFDGECNLCSGSVIFIFKRDPRGYFRFATLQEEAGRRLLAEHMGESSDQFSEGSGGRDSMSGGRDSISGKTGPISGRTDSINGGTDPISGGTESITLIEGGKMHTHSTAVLRIVRKLRHLWPLLYAFIIVPRFIRDPIYNWVARNRYRWFGKRDNCFVPSGDLTNRFIT